MITNFSTFCQEEKAETNLTVDDVLVKLRCPEEADVNSSWPCENRNDTYIAHFSL